MKAWPPIPEDAWNPERFRPRGPRRAKAYQRAYRRFGLDMSVAAQAVKTSVLSAIEVAARREGRWRVDPAYVVVDSPATDPRFTEVMLRAQGTAPVIVS